MIRTGSLIEHLPGFRAILGDDHFVAELLEGQAQHFAGDEVVFGDEDFHVGWGSSSRVRAVSTRCNSALVAVSKFGRGVDLSGLPGAFHFAAQLSEAMRPEVAAGSFEAVRQERPGAGIAAVQRRRAGR